MIVKASEIREVQSLLERVRKYNETPDELKPHPVPLDVQEPIFFAESPHLLFPLGFDEVRIIEVGDDEEAARCLEEYDWGPSGVWDYELLYRHRTSGAWYWFQGFTHKRGDAYDVNFRGPQRHLVFHPVTEYVDALHRISTNPTAESHTIIMPSLWSPGAQRRQRIILAEAVPQILKAVYAERSRFVRSIGAR